MIVKDEISQGGIGSQSSGRVSKSLSRPPQPPRTAGAIARRFFDFFRDASSGIILFGTSFGWQLSKKYLRTICFRREGYEKVKKKTLHRSGVRVTKHCKNHQKCTIWNSSAVPAVPAVPADLPKAVSGPAARTPLPTRAGGQDDVSYNKLPQTASLIQSSGSSVCSKISTQPIPLGGLKVTHLSGQRHQGNHH